MLDAIEQNAGSGGERILLETPVVRQIGGLPPFFNSFVLIADVAMYQKVLEFLEKKFVFIFFIFFLLHISTFLPRKLLNTSNSARLKVKNSFKNTTLYIF